MIKNKKAGFTDIFLFIIITFIMALIIGVFLYIGNIATDRLHATMDDMDIGDGNNNASVVIDNTMGKVNTAYSTLKWTGILIIFGMIIGIFIGSYMVTTKPIFFVPYLFIVIIAIVISVGIANAYDTIIVDPTLASTFSGNTGINWFLLNLPLVSTVVGLIGGLIMFSRLGKGEQQYYAYQ